MFLFIDRLEFVRSVFIFFSSRVLGAIGLVKMRIDMLHLGLTYNFSVKWCNYLAICCSSCPQYGVVMTILPYLELGLPVGLPGRL